MRDFTTGKLNAVSDTLKGTTHESLTEERGRRLQYDYLCAYDIVDIWIAELVANTHIRKHHEHAAVSDLHSPGL